MWSLLISALHHRRVDIVDLECRGFACAKPTTRLVGADPRRRRVIARGLYEEFIHAMVETTVGKLASLFASAVCRVC